MAATWDSAALQRLADLITERRTQLGMTKSDVARAAEVTINTYNKIEAARPVRDTTYGKVEPVLGWATGACRTVLAGADEAPVAATSPGHGAPCAVAPEVFQRDIEEALQAAAIAATDTLTTADIRKLRQHLVEELRRRGYLPDAGTTEPAVLPPDTDVPPAQ
ncbi:helix-turn-helix domain-containing protein [Streptomyces chrestomyceticus]|uniref:helix-turn-helix domain-containing protein n=1 Tax=Streptomyces chrestomyceticus TaxID=68185 RepID=UPI0037B90E0D